MVAARLKRWGNSLGIVVPRDVVRRKGLREGDVVEFQVDRKTKSYRDYFGTFKPKKSTRRLLREAREGEDKW